MSQSRISAWFLALVVLSGSVFLLEYVIFFAGSSGNGLSSGSSTSSDGTTAGHVHGRKTPIIIARRTMPPRPAPSSPREGIDDANATSRHSEERAAATARAAAVAAEAAEAAVLQEEEEEEGEEERRARRLAVVVPSHAGDLSKALTSLAAWPTRCHSSTLVNADLILYYAGGGEDDVAAVLAQLAETGGRCFANTRLVAANLRDEENVYPKGASVQFYKLFLDPNVRRQLIEYDALAIIEWDVIVAHDTSFEKLYTAAFGGVEPFWVKGSTLEGVNFHETVVFPESRYMLGHINGNAIYNNTDPGFVEYVNFTLTRWEYTQSYDVALWATISDFPYSWPLWQRYSQKFVATDLIANVGFQDMDHTAVLKAVASDTLFIHGSINGGGGSEFHAHGSVPASSPALRLVGERNRPAERCTASCGAPPLAPAVAPSSETGMAAATAMAAVASVCDRSCYTGGENGARFGGHLCGAGDVAEFGAHCRTCFSDLEEARAAEDWLAEEERLALGRRRNKKKSAVEVSLGGGGGGRGRGGPTSKRRRVLRADGGGWTERQEGGEAEGKGKRKGENDLLEEDSGSEGAGRGQEGRGNDEVGDEGEEMVEQRRHVIMCDTMMPPPPAAVADCSLKCQRKTDTVCDRSCGTGRYGSYNCNWRGYGANCRFCFNDRAEALIANDIARQRGSSVIMCHTLEPPTEEEDWEPPVTSGGEEGDGTTGGGGGGGATLQPKKSEKREPLQTHCCATFSTDDGDPYNPADEPYVNNISRGQICAFMTGFSSFLKETEVAVRSILHFMPGMRVAIATHAGDFSLFDRTLGNLQGVRISEVTSPMNVVHLMADLHCGEDTELVLYMNPGELLSRTFTSKDTHSAAGELLVMYTEVGRIGEASVRRTRATMSVLGFSTPSFSFGMDIMLPVHVNRQLRDVLLLDPESTRGAASSIDKDLQAAHELNKFPDVFVPEVLAALAYSRNEPGLWFINPQLWVTRHMFEHASIWDIPLVKPRFACAFDISMAAQGYDVAAALEAHLGHFVSGSSCERGFVHLNRATLRSKASVEFGPPTGRPMPSITGSRLEVSVVFYARGDASPTLLDVSLSSVQKMFPEAAEAVIVFTEPPEQRAALGEVIKNHNVKAPFPVEAFEYAGPPPGGGGGNGWPGWSRLRVDDHASGEFVMQLEVGDILVTEVTYDNIFHFGKPVIPFQRLSLGGGTYKPDEPYEDKYLACGIEAILEMDAVRDFALLRGLVYPRDAFSEMRMFASEVHNMDIESLVEAASGSCKGMVHGEGRFVGETVGRGIFEASLLGSFIWHYLPGMVHWRALDPLDVVPDEWLSDVNKYNLLCSMGHLEVPKDSRAARKLANALKKVKSREACDRFAYDGR